jgi:hypothetical protein
MDHTSRQLARKRQSEDDVLDQLDEGSLNNRTRDCQTGKFGEMFSD